MNQEKEGDTKNRRSNRRSGWKKDCREDYKAAAENTGEDKKKSTTAQIPELTSTLKGNIHTTRKATATYF